VRLYASLFAMLVLMLSCAPRRAHAQELAGQVYFSMDEAAHDALVDAYNCGEQRRECGGVIYRYQSAQVPYVLYLYSTPLTSNRRYGVTIPQLGRDAPRHMKIVADYHNHLCVGTGRFAPLFSFADIITNKGFHTIGYMLDGCSGNIHRFAPDEDVEDDVVVRFTSGRELDLTEGHIVGWINIFVDASKGRGVH
jgi:hypothetical protein